MLWHCCASFPPICPEKDLFSCTSDSTREGTSGITHDMHAESPVPMPRLFVRLNTVLKSFNHPTSRCFQKWKESGEDPRSRWPEAHPFPCLEAPTPAAALGGRCLAAPPPPELRLTVTPSSHPHPPPRCRPDATLWPSTSPCLTDGVRSGRHPLAPRPLASQWASPPPGCPFARTISIPRLSNQQLLLLLLLLFLCSIVSSFPMASQTSCCCSLVWHTPCHAHNVCNVLCTRTSTYPMFSTYADSPGLLLSTSLPVAGAHLPTFFPLPSRGSATPLSEHKTNNSAEA